MEQERNTPLLLSIIPGPPIYYTHPKVGFPLHPRATEVLQERTLLNLELTSGKQVLVVLPISEVEEVTGQADPQSPHPATAVLLRPRLRPREDALPHDGHVRVGEAARRDGLDRPLPEPGLLSTPGVCDEAFGGPRGR